MINYLKSMAIFAAVVEQKGFSAAGRALNLPRGKVSEQVSRLEKFLGVKLLQRSTRHVSLTIEGDTLYRHVSSLLPTAKQGVDEVLSFNQEIKGRIRLTATFDFYQYSLLPILRQYQERHNNVEFDVSITDEPLAVIDNSIDIAIRSGPLSDSNLISVPIVNSQLKLYAGVGLDFSHLQHPKQLTSAYYSGINRQSVT